MALQAAGMLWACLATSLNHPDRTNAFVQGPSRKDQNAVQKKRMSYVFGMNIKSHQVYIFNKRGRSGHIAIYIFTF